MENKDLSKCKYIYRIYVARDTVTHVEKFPVIYANKKYIYYKGGTGDSLKELLTTHVIDNNKDNIDEYIDKCVGDYIFWGRPWNSVCINIYMWDENGINMDTVNYVYELLKSKFINVRIKRATDNVQRLAKEYERATNLLNELIKEQEGDSNDT